jgi:hypothetical protein
VLVLILGDQFTGGGAAGGVQGGGVGLLGGGVGEAGGHGDAFFGVRKGAAFIFGWLVSLAIVIAFTVLVTGNNPPKPSTAPCLAALAAKLAIGAGLLVIAIRYYRKMGKPQPPKSLSAAREY